MRDHHDKYGNDESLKYCENCQNMTDAKWVNAVAKWWL